ncbi:MAG: aldo/keto reductase [Chloroflexi bacterium]|nr:aldo/keto reductase [Chloroflexota bacterium]
MDYQQLGHSGLIVSTVGLGTNHFSGRLDLERTRAVIDRAIERGITLFDTAESYGNGQSEAFIGESLGDRRHQVILATKFGWNAAEGRNSRRYLKEAVERSLRRLKTDYIDLYQIHRPDLGPPILETLQGLDDLVHEGKVRYIGHSNFAGWQIVDAHWTAQSEHMARPISAQHDFSLVSRGIEQEVLPAVRATGLGLLPYFPLASGLLTGKYRPGVVPEGTRLASGSAAERWLTEQNFALVERLETFAADHGHSLLDLAFAWLLSQTAVGSVIAGATRPEQVDQNVAAGEWRLSPAEMEAVRALL